MIDEMCCDKCLHIEVCKYRHGFKQMFDENRPVFLFGCNLFIDKAEFDEFLARKDQKVPRVVRRPIRKAAK